MQDVYLTTIVCQAILLAIAGLALGVDIHFNHKE